MTILNDMDFCASAVLPFTQKMKRLFSDWTVQTKQMVPIKKLNNRQMEKAATVFMKIWDKKGRYLFCHNV